jgi:hypothetical protein
LKNYHASSHRLSRGKETSTLVVPASESSRAGISFNSLADSSYVSVPSNSLIAVSTESISCQLICLAFWHKNNGIIEQCSGTSLDVPLYQVTCHHSACGSVRFREFACQFYVTCRRFPCNDTKDVVRTMRIPCSSYFRVVLELLLWRSRLALSGGVLVMSLWLQRLSECDYAKRGLKKLARLRFLASLFRP